MRRALNAPLLASLLFMAALLFTDATAARAQNPAAPHAVAKLLSPVTTAGSDATIPAMIDVTLEGDWKTYWRFPGEAGLPPALDWTGSTNLKSATLSYPAPHRFSVYDIDNFGYKHHVTYPLTLTPEKAGEAVDLKLKLDLLVCSDICVPETTTLSLSLPAGATAPSADSDLYRAAIDALPKTASDDISVEHATLSTDSSNINALVATVKTTRVFSADADLFVETPESIAFGKPEVTAGTDGTTVFRMPVRDTRQLGELEAALKKGDLRMTFADGDFAYEQSIALETAPGAQAATATPAPVQQAPQPYELSVSILLVALVGGLILNLMPCVLPVLSLKILSVVGHGGSDSKAKIFRNFMSSAAGIIASFWLMAGILAGLKAAGQSIGWGIQFQHPAFLVFLIVVVLFFAVNMWGLFEIPLPRFIARNNVAKHEHEPTLLGNFLTGAFATLLATPCTAPFLGTAVGFALAGRTLDIFTVFTFLGLGMALPYILLAVSPKLFRLMPKPGHWMITLKKILALILLATAVWLASILFSVTTQPTLDAGWQTFDQTLIAPAVEDGRVVIVDITADWCLTCKANKRLVLNQDDVIDALSQGNILRLQGDWTHRDETIAAYLKSFGKYGIPFNVVYGPAAPEGIILPELLSKTAVLDALDQAAGE